MEKLILLSAISSMMAFGFHDFLVKIRLSKTNIFMLYIIELSLGLLYMFPLLFVLPSYVIKGSLESRTLSLLFLIGIIHVISTLSMYYAFELHLISFISPIIAVSSALTVGLGYSLLSETIPLPRLVGIVMAIGGLLIISYKRPLGNNRNVNSIEGFVPSLVSASGWALFFLLFKMAVSSQNFIATVFFFRCFALLVMLILTILFKRPSLSGGRTFSREDIKYGSILGFLEVIGQLGVGLGLVYEEISYVVPIICLFPALTVILASRFLEEKLSKSQISAIFIIFIAVFVLGVS